MYLVGIREVNSTNKLIVLTHRKYPINCQVLVHNRWRVVEQITMVDDNIYPFLRWSDIDCLFDVGLIERIAP